MNGRAVVRLRGRDEEVRYIDHGCDKHAGTQRIDWHLTNPGEHNDDLTDREVQAMYDQLVEICRGEIQVPGS